MRQDLKLKCEYEGCSEYADSLAVGRKGWVDSPAHPGVASYCTPHADMVAEEGSPEYVQDCPNCSCRFGVN